MTSLKTAAEETTILVLRAKTEQQLCNRMWCNKSVDCRYTKQVLGAIGVVQPPPPPPAKTDKLKCQTTQNSSRFKDVVRSNDTFDPKFFRAAVRSSLNKIWRRCFGERIVEVCYRGLNLQMQCTHCSR